MSALALELSPLVTYPSTPMVRVLLVDDNDAVRSSLTDVLRLNNFAVTAAANVKDALRLIMSGVFDVLLTDLHMPAAGDGLIVVSAMRNANPNAVTLLFSGYPEIKEAAAAIILQADEILIKPMDPKELMHAIRASLKRGARPERVVESVAQILEAETETTIADWLRRVELEPAIITVPLTHQERAAHLPRLFHDIVMRLKIPLPLGTRALISPSAIAHGLARYRQGYTAAMIVEESRMLQVSVFQTLQNNLSKVDFSLLLVGVMAIADEIDSQLAQAMTSFVRASKDDGV
jgi:DNA-binding response OmpR family regulator